MSSAILNKYIRPEVLSQLTRFKLDPRQLVEGNLAGAHKSPFHGFAVERFLLFAEAHPFAQFHLLGEIRDDRFVGF